MYWVNEILKYAQLSGRGGGGGGEYLKAQKHVTGHILLAAQPNIPDNFLAYQLDKAIRKHGCRQAGRQSRNQLTSSRIVAIALSIKRS